LNRPRLGAAKLIAYGSLMSGLGLAALGRIHVRRVARVALGNARRGFAKYSQRGDRFALVLEPIAPSEPLRARALDADDTARSELEGLLLEISGADLDRVSSREGYDAPALARLRQHGVERGLPLGEVLGAILVECGGDVSLYRARVCELAAYTSPHYSPHPVELAGGATPSPSSRPAAKAAAVLASCRCGCAPAIRR
jgi:hypothetical protein